MTSKARIVRDRARRQAAGRRGELADRRFAGRAWLNGREIGGTAARHAHLEASYD